MKVALLFDNFGPYHWARAVAAAKGCQLLAVQFGAASSTYSWGQNARGELHFATLNPSGSSSDLEPSAMRQQIEAVLGEFSPEVVLIPGWASRDALLSLQWCLQTSTAAVVMSESTAWDAPRNRVSEEVKRRLLRLFAAAFVGGGPHHNYVVGLGVPADRVFTGYNAVDNNYFATEAARWKHEEPEVHRYFHSSNRFIGRKNLERLIRAFATYVQGFTADRFGAVNAGPADSENRPWNLCLLGDGEEKESLLALCGELDLQVEIHAPWELEILDDVGVSTTSGKPTVFFPGFRQIDELPRFYAHAGCFIHPALTEPWGLVVNEALASGLPVIVSDRVGCSRDLVEEGVNGFTFNPTDGEILVKLMRRVSSKDFPRHEFGEASRRIVAGRGPEAFADGLVAASRKALEVGPMKPSWADSVLLQTLCRIR